MRRCRPAVAVAVALASVVTSCSTPADTAPHGITPRPSKKTTPSTSTSTSTSSTSTTAPRPQLSLFVEPADQYASVDGLIRSAQHTLDVTMYELADPTAESLLVNARHRGVNVRVLLDDDPVAAGMNQSAYRTLTAGGVAVRWAPSTLVVQQKSLTADHGTSAILTGNLVATDYPTNRDYVVLDRVPVAVSSIEATFARDWAGAASVRPSPVEGLIWTPGARSQFVALIEAARYSVAVENSQLSAANIVGALKMASRRGVKVTVTMTSDPASQSASAGLTRAGAAVALYAPSTMPIQANAMVIDGRTAFVGSQSFSVAGIAQERGLGMTTDDPAVVVPLAQTMAFDFAGGVQVTAQHLPSVPGADLPANPPAPPTTIAGSAVAAVAPVA
jgi:phosphatidylserine/phosphatidylglycerophosphate/cardiolipin synthase-like enzyme